MAEQANKQREFMRKVLLSIVLVIACAGCHDRLAEQKQFDKRYTDLGKIYLTGDIHSAEQALVDTECLLMNEGKSYYTTNGLPMEIACLRARRAQIAERLGDHARAQQLLGEALTFAHLAGKNTNSGSAGLLEGLELLDAKRTIKWKQGTN